MSEVERMVEMLDQIILQIKNLNKSLKEILEGNYETDEKSEPA